MPSCRLGFTWGRIYAGNLKALCVVQVYYMACICDDGLFRKYPVGSIKFQQNDRGFAPFSVAILAAIWWDIENLLIATSDLSCINSAHFRRLFFI